MAGVLDQLGKEAHVAIVRLRSLGDCVLTTPAIQLLKRYRPDLRIGVVVEPRFAGIFEDNPDIDETLPPKMKALRRFHPQLAINLHGGTRSIFLTLGSGARYRAGFGHYRYAFAHNVIIPTAQRVLQVERKVHTAEHLASAMFYLGVQPVEIPRARLFALPARFPSPYAVIHALASQPGKAWPAERFLEVGAYLQSHCNLDPVFIGGPGEDLKAYRKFRTLNAPLRETMSTLAGASLFVGNDSGPAHMAAAFGIPLVVLFATSDPVVWAPWKARAETIVAQGGMSSVPSIQVIGAVDRVREINAEPSTYLAIGRPDLSVS
ncbi:MAG TPA: glycosyltransferase family 9 protein [Bryobacteraceae bacterium]|nr:glycosyltransferase family 9 protein [Bryobacteraceae bacterium]